MKRQTTPVELNYMLLQTPIIQHASHVTEETVSGSYVGALAVVRETVEFIPQFVIKPSVLSKV